MLVQKIKWTFHNNWKFCSVFEYPEFSENFSVASANISGRYREKWFCVNYKCEQIYILQKWDIEIYSENKVKKLEIWDVYYFNKNEKYYVKSNWCEILIINTPSWTPEQSEYLD